MAHAGIIAVIILLTLWGGCMPGQRSQQETEWPAIIKVARDKGLSLEDTLVLLAIRGAEQGPQGMEFGVKAAKGTDLEEQARWTAETIKKNRLRYNDYLSGSYKGSLREVKRAGEPMDFTEFMAYYASPTGYGWAPIHYKDMPEKERRLNTNWSKNVRLLTEKYRQQFQQKGLP